MQLVVRPAAPQQVDGGECDAGRDPDAEEDEPALHPRGGVDPAAGHPEREGDQDHECIDARGNCRAEHEAGDEG